MTRDNLAIWALTSLVNKFLCLFAFEGGAPNRLVILQLCHIRVKAGLGNSQNMLFRYESANLEMAYMKR